MCEWYSYSSYCCKQKGITNIIMSQLHYFKELQLIAILHNGQTDILVKVTD